MDIKSKHIHASIYAIIVVAIAVTGWDSYQTWLNPLGLKPEENPKQHDGSREFTPPIEWESAIQPMPDEDGVRRYLDPWELYNHGSEETFVEPQTIENE